MVPERKKKSPPLLNVNHFNSNAVFNDNNDNFVDNDMC